MASALAEKDGGILTLTVRNLVFEPFSISLLYKLKTQGFSPEAEQGWNRHGWLAVLQGVLRCGALVCWK